MPVVHDRGRDRLPGVRVRVVTGAGAAVDERPDTDKDTDQDDLWHIACSRCSHDAKMKGDPFPMYCGKVIYNIQARRVSDVVNLCVVCKDIRETTGCPIHSRA